MHFLAIAIVWGLICWLRAVAKTRRGDQARIPKSAPQAGETIDAYYTRMDGSEALEGTQEREGYGN